MSGVAETVAAIISGGATGLLGTVLTGVLDIFKHKQKMKEDQARWAHELATMKYESESKRAEMLIEQETKFEEVAGDVQKASYQEAMARWSAGQSGWLIFLDVARGLMRPIMTTYMFVFVTAIYFTTTDSQFEADLLNAAVYLWITSATWWFGIRGGRAPSVSKK